MLVCLKCYCKLEGDVPANNLIKISIKGLSYEALPGRRFSEYWASEKYIKVRLTELTI